MKPKNADHSGAVVPVVREELHVDAVPVETGGARIVKRPRAHVETVEQELRRGRAEVKRVKTNRVVEGPQPIRREGNTTIVPVVSEVLKIEKQLVVTEEIYITEVAEREAVRQNVTLISEEAHVEHFDNEGRVPPVSPSEIPNEAPPRKRSERASPRSLIKRANRQPPPDVK